MNVFEKFIQAVFAIGLPTSLKATRYSKTRDRLDAAYPPPPMDRPVSPGHCRGWIQSVKLDSQTCIYGL